MFWTVSFGSGRCGRSGFRAWRMSSALSSWALGRSCPKGFSTTSRFMVPPFSPSSRPTSWRWVAISPNWLGWWRDRRDVRAKLLASVASTIDFQFPITFGVGNIRLAIVQVGCKGVPDGVVHRLRPGKLSECPPAIQRGRTHRSFSRRAKPTMRYGVGSAFSRRGDTGPG